MTSIAPSAVNLSAAGAPVGVNVTTVGFGKTATAGQGIAGVEYSVQHASVACGPALGGSDALLLCFSQVTGKGTCSGDSGGPSFANISGKATQVGITSFGSSTHFTLNYLLARTAGGQKAPVQKKTDRKARSKA